MRGLDGRVRSLAGAVCAAAFLSAGALKAWDPAAFALSLARLEVVPRAWIAPAAVFVPWIEIVAGAAALSPWRNAGRAILAGLLAVFSLVLAVAWIGGSASRCGCFGGEAGLWSRLDVGLARNVLLGGLLALSCRRSAPASPASATPR
jgi:hypothetical protein